MATGEVPSKSSSSTMPAPSVFFAPNWKAADEAFVSRSVRLADPYDVTPDARLFGVGGAESTSSRRDEWFRMGDLTWSASRLAGSCRPGVLGVPLTLFNALATALTFFLPVCPELLSAPCHVHDAWQPHLVVEIFGSPLGDEVLFELSGGTFSYWTRIQAPNAIGLLCKLHCWWNDV